MKENQIVATVEVDTANTSLAYFKLINGIELIGEMSEVTIQTDEGLQIETFLFRPVNIIIMQHPNENYPRLAMMPFINSMITDDESISLQDEHILISSSVNERMASAYNEFWSRYDSRMLEDDDGSLEPDISTNNETTESTENRVISTKVGTPPEKKEIPTILHAGKKHTLQ